MRSYTHIPITKYYLLETETKENQMHTKISFKYIKNAPATRLSLTVIAKKLNSVPGVEHLRFF